MLRYCYLFTALLAVAVPLAAQAQVSVRAPFTQVDVGNGVRVRAPFVAVDVAPQQPAVPIYQQGPIVSQPVPSLPVQPGGQPIPLQPGQQYQSGQPQILPPPQVTPGQPGVGQLPPSVVVPSQPQVYVIPQPVTLAQFSKMIVGPGRYEVDLIHSKNGRIRHISVNMPVASIRRVDLGRNHLEFDFGSCQVEIRCRCFGRVTVDYDH